MLGVLSSSGGDSSTIVITLLIQLAVIIAAAKFAGEITARFLKLPTVLAELGIGVLIGPFALGALPIPGFGPLFPVSLINGIPAKNTMSCTPSGQLAPCFIYKNCWPRITGVYPSSTTVHECRGTCVVATFNY